MQKINLNTKIVHTFLGVMVLFLTGYAIWIEHNNFQNLLQTTLQHDLININQMLSAHHKKLKKEVQKVNDVYPCEYNKYHVDRLLHLDQQSEALCSWIDSSLQGIHTPYFPALNEAYYNHIMLVKNYTDWNKATGKSFSPFSPGNKPFLTIGTNLMLTQAQTAVLLNQINADYYFLTKISGCGEILLLKQFPRFSLDQLNFSDGQGESGQAVLAFYSYEDYFSSKNIHLFLNNQEFPAKDGIARFQYQFDTPGIHPLQVRWQYNYPETDSVTVFEKTYYVKVDPS